jgi:hypothetical protein
MEITQVKVKIRCPACAAWLDFLIAARAVEEAKRKVFDACLQKHKHPGHTCLEFHNYVGVFITKVDDSHCPLCGGREELEEWVDIAQLTDTKEV